MDIYEYTYGSCTTEQDFITAIDVFFTGTLGWTRIGTITNTSSDRDYVWSSPGEDTSRGTVYVRLRGYSNNIYEYGYGSWTSAVVYGHEIYNASNTYILVSATPFRYWAFGNKDFMCFTIWDGTSYSPFTGYVGFIRSYFTPTYDRVPLLVKGQTTANASWHTNESTRAYMHSTNASGITMYKTYNPLASLVAYDVHMRSSGATLWPFPLYNDTAGQYEVRGEPYGVYYVNGHLIGSNSTITTSSGVLLVYRYYGNVERCYAYGPIASAEGIVDFVNY
jgi:hypothetical protein